MDAGAPSATIRAAIGEAPNAALERAAHAFFGDPSAMLGARGSTPCFLEADDRLTAAEVGAAIEERALLLGPGRRLIALEATNTAEFAITYLACIAAHHVPLLTSGDSSDVVDRYRPDTTVDADGAIDHRSSIARHDLHPDLALLLSTSGSTGSPKLVRLSRAGLAANAAAIATYLGLSEHDRAITSLPLSYCYGLSVLHAHLVAGASAVFTDSSVTDESFWAQVADLQVTNLAGVPHTFDLIDHADAPLFESNLRFVTQAGGRMAPEKVRALADAGARHGVDLFVMYGQTEATARMAYLPPELAATRPDRVGRPVPGGSFTIEPLDETTDRSVPADAGRVVYRGPNVMMGYATTASDLAMGAELDQLVTGDIGRIDEDGLLQILGRERRFAKIYGLRIDLQRLDATLEADGLVAASASDDRQLTVAIEGSDIGLARRRTAEITSLPSHCIVVVPVDELPRLSSGKVDTGAVGRLGLDAAADAPGSGSVEAAFESVFGHAPAGTDSFVSLNGDSLSYVTMSIRLEEALGDLPQDWHERSVEELAALGTRRRGRFAHVETNVVIRAIAMCLVVGSHIRFFYVPVGAHLLLAVSGYNFARFQLQNTGAPDWHRRVARPFAKIAAVTSAWIGFSMLVWGRFGTESLLLVNNYAGDPAHTDWRWRYWYLEVTVQIGLLLFVLFAHPAVRRFEQRHPLAFVAALLVPALALRFEWYVIGGSTRNAIFQTDTVIWLFLLGWAIQRARGGPARFGVAALVLLTVPGYFFHDDRSMRLLVGVMLLALVPRVPVPRPFHHVFGWIASASLVIYLTHYPMIRPLRSWLPRSLTFVVIMVAGLLIWAALQRLVRTKGLHTSARLW
ncbi:MAG: AMP-binding protein [Actinomycetota bacterium]